MRQVLPVGSSVIVFLWVCTGLTITAVSSASYSYPGLTTKWNLPLDIGPEPYMADDGENIYTADKRGTIFAVRASDGRLLWSVDGNSTLQSIQTLPEYPGIVYYGTYWVNQANSSSDPIPVLRVHALSTKDGSALGTLELASCPYLSDFAGSIPLLQATNYGIMYASSHRLGAMDAELRTTYWSKYSIPKGGTEGYIFSHVTTNGDLIAASHWLPDISIGWPTNLQSFDAKTGDMVCNITNTSYVEGSVFSVPFTLTKDGYIWESYLTPDPSMGPGWFNAHQRIFNLYTCNMSNSSILDPYQGVNSSITPVFEGITSLIISRITGTPADGQVWNLGSVTVEPTNDYNWKTNLSNPHNLNLSLAVPPVIGFNVSDRQVLTVYSAGALTGLNTTTGEKLWEFNQTYIPTGPPNAKGQFLFPLPPANSGRTLVPNLEGYLIINTELNTMEQDRLTPVSGLAKFHSFMTNSSSTGSPTLVFVDHADGSLVGAF